MFDNPEIKRLRQDIDALSEQIEKLIEKVEVQHTDVMNTLELIEDGIQKEVSSDDIEDIKSGIEEVKIAVENVEGTLEDQ